MRARIPVLRLLPTLAAFSFLVGCTGARATPEPAPAPTSTAAEPAPKEELPACAAARQEILAAMESARAETPCAAATDCATVTGPGHPASDFQEVVPATVAATFEARSRAHLEHCGAFHAHDPSAGFTTVEAVCGEQRCLTKRTTVSGDDP